MSLMYLYLYLIFSPPVYESYLIYSILYLGSTKFVYLSGVLAHFKISSS